MAARAVARSTLPGGSRTTVKVLTESRAPAIQSAIAVGHARLVERRHVAERRDGSAEERDREQRARALAKAQPEIDKRFQADGCQRDGLRRFGGAMSRDPPRRSVAAEAGPAAIVPRADAPPARAPPPADPPRAREDPHTSAAPAPPAPRRPPPPA